MLNEESTTEDAPVGSPDTSLVILRGNSGSGKSTIARAVRDRYGRGCALVEQDYLRRTVLRERDVQGGNTAALIEHVVRFALDVGYHVICEGILHGSRYGPMLTRLAQAHRGATTVFYLDVPFDETLRRHAGRPQAREFTPDDMRGWYVPHDLLGIPGEQVIDGSRSLDEAVGLVAAHLPPIATPFPVANGKEE